jgi:hypothetical protein
MIDQSEAARELGMDYIKATLIRQELKTLLGPFNKMAD